MTPQTRRELLLMGPTAALAAMVRRNSALAQEVSTMPAVIPLIVTAIGVAASVANIIATWVLRRPDSSSSDQDSLVAGYARDVYYKGLKDNGRSDFTAVVLKSNLNVNIKWEKGGYIAYVKIGPAGYSVYFVKNGYVANYGSRGYSNWTVVGNSRQRQENNIIYID
jgi:hypothetical protein